MSVTIVSFFTPQDDYPKQAERFVGELEALGLEYFVAEAPDQGSYLANIRQKALVCWRSLLQLGKPILFVDVDGTVCRKPDLDLSVDFAAVPKPEDHPRRWFVGCLFFNYTTAGIDLAQRWVRATGDWSDESALDDVWKAGEWEGTWLELGPEYMEILRNENADPSPDTVVAIRLSKGRQKMAFHASGRTERPTKVAG